MLAVPDIPKASFSSASLAKKNSQPSPSIVLIHLHFRQAFCQALRHNSINPCLTLVAKVSQDPNLGFFGRAGLGVITIVKLTALDMAAVEFRFGKLAHACDLCTRIGEWLGRGVKVTV